VPDDYVRLKEAVADGGGTLINRMAHVDEVAELVIFLAGPAGRSLTGAVIPFDAGYIAH
jgi:NAD(P)-dependent dehydrogenase (short-subunit alcohol dehydrogenase family)